MRNKILAFAGVLALLGVVGKFYATPLLAQARAALVQNVDEPGRHPIALGATVAASRVQWNVPATQRYVVEQFSANCDVLAGSSLSDLSLLVISSGTSLDLHASPHFVQPNGGVGGQAVNRWAGSGTARIYADPGGFIQIAATEASGNDRITECTLSVSGYAINNP
jgi:hypothetical protein